MQTEALGRRAGHANNCSWDKFPRSTSRRRDQPKEIFNAMANPTSL